MGNGSNVLTYLILAIVALVYIIAAISKAKAEEERKKQRQGTPQTPEEPLTLDDVRQRLKQLLEGEPLPPATPPSSARITPLSTGPEPVTGAEVPHKQAARVSPPERKGAVGKPRVAELELGKAPLAPPSLPSFPATGPAYKQVVTSTLLSQATRSQLQQAVVWREVLGPPVGQRGMSGWSASFPPIASARKPKRSALPEAPSEPS